MAGEDFVMVQLSAKGEALAEASGGSITTSASSTFVFTRGADPQRLTRNVDWELLSQVAVDGEPLFELAPTRSSASRPSPSNSDAASAAHSTQEEEH